MSIKEKMCMMKQKLFLGSASVITTIGTSGLLAHAEGAVVGDYASINTSMQTAFSNVVTETISGIGLIAPKAILIFGCMFIWKKGKKFFNALT